MESKMAITTCIKCGEQFWIDPIPMDIHELSVNYVCNGCAKLPPSYGPAKHGEREWNARRDQLTDKGMIEFMP
jgi:hypothetical protein